MFVTAVETVVFVVDDEIADALGAIVQAESYTVVVEEEVTFEVLPEVDTFPFPA